MLAALIVTLMLDCVGSSAMCSAPSNSPKRPLTLATIRCRTGTASPAGLNCLRVQISYGLSTRSRPFSHTGRGRHGAPGACLLYTSDAADDLLCVDLGGR